MTKDCSIELEELKIELKNILKDIGWNEKKLAEELVKKRQLSGIPIEKDYKNGEVSAEYEKIKHQLSRKTTKSEVIKYYINFVITHRDAKGFNFIKPPELSSSYRNSLTKEQIDIVDRISLEDFFSNK